ncbi:MAG: nucleoside 2-deoxyribosyltransferase [Bacteroidota bacterium]
MKKIFLAISFNNRSKFNDEIITIEDVIKECGYEPMTFVNNYSFLKNEEKAMMLMACREIQESEILIAEVSNKVIGVGIEIGYACALNKPVIYLQNDTAEYSLTVGGMAQDHIIYSSVEDLRNKLKRALNVNFWQ